MSTDPIPAIRHKVESLVKDIDNKYQGMVQVWKLYIIEEMYDLFKMYDFLSLRAKQCKEFDQRSLYRRE